MTVVAGFTAQYSTRLLLPLVLMDDRLFNYRFLTSCMGEREALLKVYYNLP